MQISSRGPIISVDDTNGLPGSLGLDAVPAVLGQIRHIQLLRLEQALNDDN